MKKIYSAILVSLLLVLTVFGLTACKKNFTVTVTGGTASVSKTAAGVTVTLTVDESKTPIGKAFHHWESAEVEIEGDTFVMPAKNVNVSAVYDGTYNIVVEGGFAVSEARYKESVKLTVDMSKVPEGKEFECWTTSDSSVIIDTHYVQMPAKDITVTANYRSIVGPSYRLTYITNVEKDTLIRHSFILPNEIPSRPMDVEMPEHHILGWFRDEKYTRPFNFDSPLAFEKASDVNFTLFAKWSITVYQHGDLKYGIDKETNEIVITGLTEQGLTKEAITIPQTIDGRSVTMIGAYSFKNASLLSSITIPEGVTLIGDNAFYNCGALTTVSLPSTLAEIGYYAFRGCKSITAVSLPVSLNTLREGAFSHCSSLSAIDIPDKVGVISAHTFEFCVNLISAKIGAGVTRIEEEAFYSSALTEAVIPQSVKHIGESAFAKCGLLRLVKIEGTQYIGSNAFNTLVPADYFVKYGFLTVYAELPAEKTYLPLKIVFSSELPKGAGYSVFGFDASIFTDAEDDALPAWIRDYSGQLYSLDELDSDIGGEI